MKKLAVFLMLLAVCLFSFTMVGCGKTEEQPVTPEEEAPATPGGIGEEVTGEEAGVEEAGAEEETAEEEAGEEEAGEEEAGGAEGGQEAAAEGSAE
ncbi:MAG TPA: hypothetical protein EYP56_10150 [Planctomycetaceae bacterium]|nr:hypothetical protein [Planctomycetaceae bacterium]